MIAESIGLTLRNFPAILLVVALLIAAWHGGPEPAAERFLSWLLLLPVGVMCLWASVYHLLFPATAAAYIGWQVSPFQFEVGVADLAIGVTACLAFRRSLAFKAAVVCIASVFLLGDAVGHVRQMVAAGNFAPGNAGVVFYVDVICPVLAVALLAASHRRHLGAAAPTAGGA